MTKNKTKHNTTCVGHHYMQSNTNNINKTTGGKAETEHRYYAEIVTGITTRNSERKDT